MKLSISLLVFFLLALSLMGLNGCDRQAFPPKAVKELPQTPEASVGEMARSVIETDKGVAATLEEAGKRAAGTSKEAVP